MKIKIKYVKNAGDIKNERLVLEAIENVEIGRYIIADTTYLKEGSVSNLLRHVYWLPDQVVSAGDIIVVYTKEGYNSSKRNKLGNNSYFYYWGLERTIWNKNGDSAIILEINDWNAKKVS